MSKKGSQVLPQTSEGQKQIKVNPTLMVKLMIGFLYFCQGFMFAISATTPYTYSTLPDYFTLSLFTLSPLSYSLKFITAPILEKHTSLKYGKRKTWIVISQLIACVLILQLTRCTELDQAKTFAMTCFAIYFILSLQDISVDSLCLKQLQCPKLMSMIQSAFQSSGVIIGGLIILKFTSLQFAQRMGFKQPFTNLRTILVFATLVLFVCTVLVHLLFNETYLGSEARSTKISTLKVYSIYRYYLKTDYRYCRTAILLLFMNVGFNFFSAGYTYELIQKGFSRDTLNTIDNFENIALTLLIFFFGSKATLMGYKKTLIFIKTISLVLSFCLWIFFPTSGLLVAIANFITGFLIQWEALNMTPICANFPENGATGMLYTMNASSANFGRNKFIHTAILKKLPWRTVALAGLIIQIPLSYIFLPKMMDLIENGKTQIEVLESQKNEQQQNSCSTDTTKLGKEHQP